jgi:hypothetical protein
VFNLSSSVFNPENHLNKTPISFDDANIFNLPYLDDTSLIKLDLEFGKNFSHIFLTQIKDITLLQDYFSKLDETTLTDIVNTTTLSDEIRDMAFKNGCCIDNISNPTEYIVNELFYMTFDTCKSHVLSSDSDLPNDCYRILLHLFDKGKLNHKQQKDFVLFIKNTNTKFSDQVYFLYTKLLPHITDPWLIEYILQRVEYLPENYLIFNQNLDIKKRETLLPNLLKYHISVFKNKTRLSTSQYENSIKAMSTIAKSLELQIPQELQNELCSFNHYDINKALSSNPNTSIEVLEKLRFVSEFYLDVIFNSTLCLSCNDLKIKKKNIKELVCKLCQITTRNEYNTDEFQVINLYFTLENPIKNLLSEMTEAEKLVLHRILEHQKTFVSVENDALNFMINIINKNLRFALTMTRTTTKF